MNPSGSDLETERVLCGRVSMLKINSYSNHEKRFKAIVLPITAKFSLHFEENRPGFLHLPEKDS
jgi:hypothetical protein